MTKNTILGKVLWHVKICKSWKDFSEQKRHEKEKLNGIFIIKRCTIENFTTSTDLIFGTQAFILVESSQFLI